ncbi:hypothetical protein [Desulfoscipio gibsoniae]
MAKIIADFEADGIKTIRGKEKGGMEQFAIFFPMKDIWAMSCCRKHLSPTSLPGAQRKMWGNSPCYYVHDCHPAIIDKDIFYRVHEDRFEIVYKI